MSGELWTPTREWDGETCFVLCGGPSAAAHDLTKLKGRRLIATNTSIFTTPWADFLVFADTRWWDDNVKHLLHGNGDYRFSPGRIVCVSSLCRNRNLLRMKRIERGGLSMDPAYLRIKYTVTISAINLAAHLGARRIVTVGLDGKNGGADGNQSHHHVARPHPWKQKPNAFEKQRRDFQTILKDLVKLGIEVVNASPGSALADLWPVVDFDAEIERDDARRAAASYARLSSESVAQMGAM